MKQRFVLPGVLVIAAIIAIIAAGIFSVALAAMPSLWPGRGTANTNFDPLFAGSACTPARSGPPPLLAHLVLAQERTQAQTPPAPPVQPETRPFVPARQAPSTAPRSATGAAAPPPLYDNMGAVHVPITTQNPRAQAYVDQGIRLTFAFNHAEAARAFRAAQDIDPACAMCYWREALVLGPNINAPMFPGKADGPPLTAL